MMFLFPLFATATLRAFQLASFIVVLFYSLQVNGDAPYQASSTMYGPPGFSSGQPLGQYGSSRGRNGDACRNRDLEENKRTVMSFYQDVFGDKKFDLLEKYIATDVINHNPMEVDGIDGLREVLMGPLGQGPPMKIDFRRVSGEGDLVWTHSRLPVPSLGITYAAIDIFRIDCEGKIAEHWDVLQDTNVESKNNHPFF